MPLYFYILPLHFSPCFVSPLSPRLRYLFLIRTYLFIFSFVPSCIKACRYYLKYNSVFTLSFTNHSSALKTFLVIINHCRDEFIEIFVFTIAIIILRSPLSSRLSSNLQKPSSYRSLSSITFAIPCHTYRYRQTSLSPTVCP